MKINFGHNWKHVSTDLARSSQPSDTLVLMESSTQNNWSPTYLLELFSDVRQEESLSRDREQVCISSSAGDTQLQPVTFSTSETT